MLRIVGGQREENATAFLRALSAGELSCHTRAATRHAGAAPRRCDRAAERRSDRFEPRRIDQHFSRDRLSLGRVRSTDEACMADDKGIGVHGFPNPV